MRDIERILIAFNLIGATAAGVRQELLWFPLAVLAFGLYVLIEDRALRRRIGARAWPSEGFARFNFNTNLNFGLSHLLLGALVFVTAGMAATTFGI